MGEWLETGALGEQKGVARAGLKPSLFKNDFKLWVPVNWKNGDAELT